MTGATGRHTDLPRQYRSRVATTGEVVAGLVNNGSADAVAVAAVTHATSRHTAVRFVQIVPGDPHSDEESDADVRTFAAAMRALVGAHRVRCTFEVVSGDPVKVLVDRSVAASVLVVGADRSGVGSRIAASCVLSARCPVDVVPWVDRGP